MVPRVAEAPEGFGARLRMVRERIGVSREKLAAEVGTVGGQIYKIERGDHLPNAALMHRLCEHLRISSDWLLTGREALERGGLDETYPDEWRGFVETDLGASATERELDALRSMRGIVPSVQFLQSLLLLVRNHITTEEARETADRMERAARTAAAKGVRLPGK